MAFESVFGGANPTAVQTYQSTLAAQQAAIKNNILAGYGGSLTQFNVTPQTVFPTSSGTTTTSTGGTTTSTGGTTTGGTGTSSSSGSTSGGETATPTTQGGSLLGGGPGGANPLGDMFGPVGGGQVSAPGTFFGLPVGTWVLIVVGIIGVAILLRMVGKK